MDNKAQTQLPDEEVEDEEKDGGKKPSTGAWDQMPSEPRERLPKVEFPFNKEVRVEFDSTFEKPLELPSKDKKDDVFYIFEVIHNREHKVIMTSAWSLLRDLKMQMPLAGKVLDITKGIKNGKQNYAVKFVGFSENYKGDLKALNKA